jgi:tetratricopeptide (TPR) repeat protein
MLHQTVREYAQQQQEEMPQRRLVSYMVGYLHTHQRDYDMHEQEMACIQEALEKAHALQMHQELLAGLRTGMPFFQARGLYRMAEHYLWYGWEAVSKQGDTDEQAVVAQHLALTLCKLGNYTSAKELAEQGLALTAVLDEKQLRSRLLQTLGDIADNEGDRARAEVYYQEGLRIAELGQNSFLVCSLSINCGKIAWFQGRQAQSLHYYEEAMRLARQHQYQEELGLILGSLAVSG